MDGNDYFKINYPFYVASMTAFLSRLHGDARQSQVKISDNTRVTGVIIEDNYVRGLRCAFNGEPFEARAKLANQQSQH